jgi:ligand-binding SRPBCC domain-containing protein
MRVPTNLLRMFPEKSTRNIETRFPPVLEVGSLLEFQFKAVGFSFQIILEVTDLLSNERIVAIQRKGPFRSWTHELRFEDAPAGETLLTNNITFEPPGGMLGLIATEKTVVSQLESGFVRGHEMLRQSIAESPLN